jgi:hypothetical protein
MKIDLSDFQHGLHRSNSLHYCEWLLVLLVFQLKYLLQMLRSEQCNCQLLHAAEDELDIKAKLRIRGVE